MCENELLCSVVSQTKDKNSSARAAAGHAAERIGAAERAMQGEQAAFIRDRIHWALVSPISPQTAPRPKQHMIITQAGAVTACMKVYFI